MKDDYRWYNSVLFNKRHEITDGWPSEQERMNNDWRLRPFEGMRVGGQKPVATPEADIQGDNTGNSNLNNLIESNFGGEQLPADSKMTDQNQAEDIKMSHINGSLTESQALPCLNGDGRPCPQCSYGLRTLKGDLIACCGAGVAPVYDINEEIPSNLPYKGPSPVQLNVVESLHEETQEDAIEDLKYIENANKIDPNREPNKFTQYGGWTTEGLGDKSMYGINHSYQNAQVVKQRYEGDQEESCRNRLLMGHGLHISQVSFFHLTLILVQRQRLKIHKQAQLR